MTMEEISGTPWECEMISRLLRGPKAAPVILDYAPGNATCYRLCITPCVNTHVLTDLRMDSETYIVVWINHGHFLVDLTDGKVHPDQLMHTATSTKRIVAVDAQILADFLNRVLPAKQVALAQAPAG